MATLIRLLAAFVLIFLNVSSVTGIEVFRSTDGTCHIYDYITGFSLKAVDFNRYRLENAFCQGLSKPHIGQSNQCIVISRKVERTHENWNQCPAGFFLQSNDQYTMECCKPSGQPYTASGCIQQTIKSNSYEVHCPAGLVMVKTRDSFVGDHVCTSAVTCCKMLDEPAPVLSLEDVKVRVMDDTQVPLSLLAHFLGYAWCGGCNARYVGESMASTSQGWKSDTSGTCQGKKPKDRLSIDYSDWKLIPSKQVFSEVQHTNLKPNVILTGTFINNDTHPKTFTVGQEITRMHTISHTKMSSFSLSHDVEFEVSYESSFLGGLEFSTKYSFGYETTEEEVKGNEHGESSTLSYGSEVTLGPCSAVEYSIFLASTKATQYYDAALEVSYSAELDGFLRYGGGPAGRYTNFHRSYRGSTADPQFKYKFGNAHLSLHDDLMQQRRDGKGPWEWLNMIDRYPLASSLIDMLSDHTRHEFNISGKFEEIAGHTASILFQWKVPPAGCVKPAANAKLARTAQSQKLNITNDETWANFTTDTAEDDNVTAEEKATINSPAARSANKEDGTTTTKSTTTRIPEDTLGTTPAVPEMQFETTYVRTVDMETGEWADMADEDMEVLLQLLNTGDTTPTTEKEKLTYLLTDSTKNPNFDFTAFFVALKGDNKIVGGTEFKFSSNGAGVPYVPWSFFLVFFICSIFTCSYF